MRIIAEIIGWGFIVYAISITVIALLSQLGLWLHIKGWIK